jgi:hypothetical protein
MKRTYYRVMERCDNEECDTRRIWSFEVEAAAYGLIEYIKQNDPMLPADLYVEEFTVGGEDEATA